MLASKPPLRCQAPHANNINRSIDRNHSETTYFSTIDRSMSNEWTYGHASNHNVKQDKAPVPSHVWDVRLKALFPNRNIEKLLPVLRTLYLRRHRRRLLK